MKSYVVVAILAVILLGGLAAWTVMNRMNPDTNQNSDPDTPMASSVGQTTLNESAELNTTIQEHAVTASLHLQNLYDGKDITATSQKLGDNSSKAADFFSTKVGVNREEFLTMWNGHIAEYENYTKALKNNDRDGTAAAKSRLEQHATMMGEAVHAAKNTLPAEEVTQLMNEHIDLTLAIIEAYAAGNLTDVATRGSEASAQGAKFADRIIDGLEGEAN